MPAAAAVAARRGPSKQRAAPAGGAGKAAKARGAPSKRSSSVAQQASSSATAAASARQPSNASASRKSAKAKTSLKATPSTASASPAQPRDSTVSPVKGRRMSAAHAQQADGDVRSSSSRSPSLGRASVEHPLPIAYTPNRRGSRSGSVSNVYAASCYSSRVYPQSPRSGARRRRSSVMRRSRRVSEAVAVARLQRAARGWLMRRAVKQHSSVTMEGTLCSSEVEADGDRTTTMTPPSAACSLLVRRLRAELQRREQLAKLRAAVARRCIEAALLKWVRSRRAEEREADASDNHAILSGSQDMNRSATACGLHDDASHSQQGRLHNETPDEQHLRRKRAARVIQRAWRRSTLCARCTRHIQDRRAREMLCRHEMLERRDLLRRHTVFLVRCHQLLYNDRCMWEAGLAIRRLPLYRTGDDRNDRGGNAGGGGLFLSNDAPAATPSSLPTAQRAAQDDERADARGASTNAGVLPHLFGSANGVMPHTSSPASVLRSDGTVVVGTAGSNHGSSPRFEEPCPSSAPWWESTHFDVNAALHLCEYRLFFSPEEWQLLGEDSAPPPPLTAAPLEPDRSGCLLLLSSSSASHDAPQRRPLTESHEGDTAVACAKTNAQSNAEAFASALTLLRQPPVVDPSIAQALQHLQDMRSNPLQLQRVLRTHGYLPVESVAPFACYGALYQRVARGDGDGGALVSTSSMQACMPVVAGAVTYPAAELPKCLVAAVVRDETCFRPVSGAASGDDCGGVSQGRAPVPVEELFCRIETAFRTHTEPAAERLLVQPPGNPPSSVLCTAAAKLQRRGYAEPATEALFHAPRDGPVASAVAQPSTASAIVLLREKTSPLFVWDHRLAAGENELGTEWRAFLLAIASADIGSSGGDAGAIHTRLSSGETRAFEREEEAPSSLPSPSIMPPAPQRRFVGLHSQLGQARTAAAANVLLSDFVPLAAHSQCSSKGAPPEMLKSSAIDSVAASVAVELPHRRQPGEWWWDAVERMLIQERTNRLSLGRSEADQRRSLGVLQSLSRPATIGP